MLILQRRPVADKTLESHVWPGAESKVETDSLARLQCTLDLRFEIPTQRSGAVIGEELEDICANSLSVPCCLCFDWE